MIRVLKSKSMRTAAESLDGFRYTKPFQEASTEQ